MTTNHWQLRPLAVLDTETTGLNPQADRVIEVGIAVFQAGEIIDRYQTLVNPECEVPEEAVRITGIQSADLVDAPRFPEIAETVLRLLKDNVVVAYNLTFDKRFLEAEFARCGLNWPEVPTIDPLVFVRELHRDQGSKRLEAAAARLGIEHNDAHRALSDAIVAGHVLMALAPQLPSDLDDLLTLQNQWIIKQEQEMASWRKRQDGALSPDTVKVGLADENGLAALGPAFIYGSETDPLRALFAMIT